MTAPMAADKMSLVQIMSPFSGLGGFLYDTIELVIDLAHFYRNLRTISYHNRYKIVIPPYLFCLVNPYNTGYMIKTNILEIDTC